MGMVPDVSTGEAISMCFFSGSPAAAALAGAEGLPDGLADGGDDGALATGADAPQPASRNTRPRASGRLLEVKRIARILGHGRRARMPVKDSEQETGYGQDSAHRD